MTNGTLLITGGLGYIGSHVAALCMQEGYKIIIVDNLENSSASTLDHLQDITGTKPIMHEADIRDMRAMERVFTQHTDIQGVIHLAGRKAVQESCEKPYEYYDSNINGSMRLLYLLNKYDISNLVFSSTAAVYDTKNSIPPYTESDNCRTINPYGTSKYIVEQLLADVSQHKYVNAVILRYFNVIGAHPSGRLGDNPSKPANLLHIISDVLQEKRKNLSIYGKDYPTKDGTAIRDYIHVMDIARAHLHAYEYITAFHETTQTQDHQIQQGLHETFNLSTGEGSSVLEVIEAVEKVTQQAISYTYAPRRQ